MLPLVAADESSEGGRRRLPLALRVGSAILLAITVLFIALYATSFSSNDAFGGLLDLIRDRPPNQHPASGDLVRVSTNIVRVGVLVGEMPHGVRRRFVAWILAKPDSWWKTRARLQLKLTSYKLAFLSTFDNTKQQLMLPDDDAAIDIIFKGPAKRHVINDGGFAHEMVTRRYRVHTYIVGSPGSAVTSAAELGAIGGRLQLEWDLPIDPYLLYQRSGYACADEDQFPHGSLDAESTWTYYDDTCEPGDVVPNDVQCTFAEVGCHCSQGSSLSCFDALAEFTGRDHMVMDFHRVGWAEGIARYYENINTYRVDPHAQGADMVGYEAGLHHHFVVYDYFTEESCQVTECVKQSGWRKLLKFDGTHVNVGNEPIVLGSLPYTTADPGSFVETTFHNMYYWDPCHRHPHFAQYVTFAYDSIMGHKQGFCIESTNRIINSRQVSISSPHWNCSYQGISVGWADQYNAGIPCQWVDITDALDAHGPLTRPLVMIGNPVHWICEGRVVYDSFGQPVWRSTGNVTVSPPWPTAGQPIDVYDCVTSPGAWDNNFDAVNVVAVPAGHGLITSPCAGQTFGPKRDCDFVAGEMMHSCTPGAAVHLSCSIAAASKPQVLRLCESSVVLHAGTACRFNDDFTLANRVLLPGVSTAVSFTCPAARDAAESGGYYSSYSGAVFNGVDAVAPIVCNPV